MVVIIYYIEALAVVGAKQAWHSDFLRLKIHMTGSAKPATSSESKRLRHATVSKGLGLDFQKSARSRLYKADMEFRLPSLERYQRPMVQSRPRHQKSHA